MGGKPRSHQQWVPRPSPLAKVHLTRPISHDPTMGLVRDPQFWKRFSQAVHQKEDVERSASRMGEPVMLSTKSFGSGVGSIEDFEGYVTLVQS